MSSQTDNSIFLDFTNGAARLGGNEALYKKLLKSFVAGNYFEIISEKIQNNNLEAAAQAAHTIKGVSANLSLKRVNELSAELEQQLKSGGNYSETFSLLEEANKKTLELIEEITAE